MTAAIAILAVAAVALLIVLDTRAFLRAHAVREASERRLEDALDNLWDDAMADIRAREDLEPWQRGGQE